jgi:RNA polymerase sigma factor (TIGR02999 family)
MSEVSQVLNAAQRGDPHAASQLLPLVYDELRRLAAQKLAHEKQGQTLQPTALVHEAYLRLVGNDHGTQPWDGRGHFFAAAAEAMRRILVERARAKATLKRGGKGHRLDLDQVELACNDRAHELLALDEALAELERHDAQAAQLVKLRYYAGLTHQQAAEALGISRRAADRLWVLARAWLYQQIGEP